MLMNAKHKVLRRWTERVPCPWCNEIMKVDVDMATTNQRAPGAKRATITRIRRSASTEHPCVDPTLALEHRKLEGHR